MPTPPEHRPRASAIVRVAACGALLIGCAAGMAQTGLAPASPTTPNPTLPRDDVPGRLRPTPKVTGPSDAQRSLNLNNPQPEGRVTPQIRVPFGKKPDAQILQRKPTETGSTSTPGGGFIGDAAAQCEAQRGEQVRARCRDRLSRQGVR